MARSFRFCRRPRGPEGPLYCPTSAAMSGTLSLPAATAVRSAVQSPALTKDQPTCATPPRVPARRAESRTTSSTVSCGRRTSAACSHVVLRARREAHHHHRSPGVVNFTRVLQNCVRGAGRPDSPSSDQGVQWLLPAAED